MISWLIRLSGLGFSWHFTELASSNIFHNAVCPLFVGIFLISVILKIAAMMGPGGGTGGAGSSGGMYFGGSGSDGCGGGGDC